MSNFTAQDIIFGLRFNKLIFTVPTLIDEGGQGYFPNNIIPGSNVFSIQGTSSQKIEIDWGDGSFEIINSSSFSFSGNYHVYTDGLTEHVIQITFENPSLIKAIFSQNCNIGINYPVDILKFTNLTSISHVLFAGVQNFPDDLSPLTKLSIFKLENSTLPNIPESIFSLNLVELSLRGSVDLSLTGSNIDRIGELQNTLELLLLQSTGIENNTLPNSLLECDKITSMDIGRNPFTILPPVLPQSLKNLVMDRPADLGSWTNFDRLINLENLSITNRGHTYLYNPDPSLSALTKLKAFTFACGSLNVDAFANNWFNLIETNANKDDAAIDQKFRNILFNPQGAPKPTGTYQAPTGYVPNVDNGSPSSPLEKVWLMVNQYGCTVNVPTT